MIYTREYGVSLSPEKIGKHIEHFFDVHTEWSTIQSQLEQGTTHEDILFYGRESLMKFILEFAAATKQTSITYQVKSNGIHFPGIQQPVRAMFENSANMAGPYSRESAELAGWEKAEQMIAQGSEQFILISPPSVEQNGEFKYGFGSYGFLFYFTRDDYGRLKNTILRYKEDNKLATSRLLGYGLNLDPAEKEKANGYLRSPIDVTNLDKKSLNSILRYVGYSENDSRAERLERVLLKNPNFSLLFQQYVSSLMSARPDFGHMKELMTKLYTVAYEIIQREEELPFPPPIFSGGSCPVSARFNFNYFMPRYIDVSRLHEIRITTCPSCNRKSLMQYEVRSAHKMACKCGNSTTCPEAIYDNSRRADNWELEHFGFVETWD